jgi:hypothetical protein
MSQDRGAYIHLFALYQIWGSTFVAMRAAVMGDEHTPSKKISCKLHIIYFFSLPTIF